MSEQEEKPKQESFDIVKKGFNDLLGQISIMTDKNKKLSKE